jgi:hypothetical protein
MSTDAAYSRPELLLAVVLQELMKLCMSEPDAKAYIEGLNEITVPVTVFHRSNPVSDSTLRQYSYQWKAQSQRIIGLVYDAHLPMVEAQYGVAHAAYKLEQLMAAVCALALDWQKRVSWSHSSSGEAELVLTLRRPNSAPGTGELLAAIGLGQAAARHSRGQAVKHTEMHDDLAQLGEDFDRHFGGM